MRLLLAACVALLAQSCSSGGASNGDAGPDDASLGPPPDAGAFETSTAPDAAGEGIVVDVDGVATSFVTSLQGKSPGAGIFGVSATAPAPAFSPSIALTFPTATGVGSFPCSAGASTTLFYYEQNDAGTTVNYSASTTGGLCSVNVTHLAKAVGEIASGTFSGTVMGPNGAQHSLTAGKFNVKRTQ